MNQMEEALYRVGAHIVFKKVGSKPEPRTPTRKLKTPIPIWNKRRKANKSSQRIIGGIPRDPIDRQAAIVTSKTPKDCQP